MEDDQSWIWRVADAAGKSEESPCRFATLKECTAHAMQHGYVAWKSEDERRRDATLAVTKVLARHIPGKS